MAARIYVGNLPLDVNKNDLLDLFERYGHITDVNIKAGSRPPAFAFVEFQDSRDASEAVRAEDGRDFLGERIRVEYSRGGRERRPGGGGREAGNTRRTDYRISLSGLHQSVSWQDLKDFLRKGGEVVYTNVNRDGTGVAEFATYDDMKRAVRKLDDTDLRGSYVRIKEAGGDRSRSRSPPRRHRSRSPPRRRGRSRSRSRERRRSRSRSDSRSPPRRRSPSPEKDPIRGFSRRNWR